MMKNLLGGYTFIDMRNVETKTSHTIAGLYGEVQKKIAETDKPLMIHNFVYNGENINDTMITNVEEGESDAIVLTIGTSYKLTIATNSSFTAEAYSAGGGELPIASSETLGGIKVGTGLTINSETGVLNTTANAKIYRISLAGLEWTSITGGVSVTNAGKAAEFKALLAQMVDGGNMLLVVEKLPINFVNAAGYLQSKPDSAVLISGEQVDYGSTAHVRFDIASFDSTQKVHIMVSSTTISVYYERVPLPTASPIAEIVDSDSISFAITTSQPIANIVYDDPNPNACLLHFKKTGGTISVYDATSALVWQGDHIEWAIPVQDSLADAAFTMLELAPNSTSYTEKMFLVRAHRDGNGHVVVEIKEFPTT